MRRFVKFFQAKHQGIKILTWRCLMEPQGEPDESVSAFISVRFALLMGHVGKSHRGDMGTCRVLNFRYDGSAVTQRSSLKGSS